MKKSLIIGALLVVGLASTAQAKTITRDGSDYNGFKNPGGCRILVHDDQPTELHVNCKDATAPARIRYRYLRDVGGKFEPAKVDFDWLRHGGQCSPRVSWQVLVPRTLRIIVNPGCYLHILKVYWQQPAR